MSDPGRTAESDHSREARTEQVEPEAGHRAALIVASGRTLYLWLTIRSLRRALTQHVDIVCLVDTTTSGIRRSLVGRAARLGHGFHHVRLPSADLATAWRGGLAALDEMGAEFVLHVEEDFLFLRRIDLTRMVAQAAVRGRAQVLLTRQRWFRSEFEHRRWTDFLASRYSGAYAADGMLELSELFSANPSLYRLDRALSVVAAIPVEATGPFERQMFDAAQELGLRAAVDVRSTTLPDVLHIGAVNTSRHRQLARRSRLALVLGYVRTHLVRSTNVVVRHVRWSRFR